MATDPAVDPIIEAAARATAVFEDQGDWTYWLKSAELIVAAVRPLIRRQAFNEAVGAIQACLDRQPLNDKFDVMMHVAYNEAIRSVRGLGEETASVDSKINKA